jgi:beta-galactosidase
MHVPAEVNVVPDSLHLIDYDAHYLIVKGDDFELNFKRRDGFLCKYLVDGHELLNDESSLRPNFWRAPTDNDFGANLQMKYRVWLNPEMKLKSLKALPADSLITVTAEYDMPDVSSKLTMTYLINTKGAIKVTEKMHSGRTSNMFRFGMQMQMPESFSHIVYYGRGPIENYADRKTVTDLGIYHQSVAEQYYPYIRPQETGTKSDIRWWRQLNVSGFGLEFVSEAPFSASALNYSIASLDEGTHKINRHAAEVTPVNYTNLCIDKVQMGLGCVNSWGALPLKQYMLPHGDYEFTFVMTPVEHKLE